MGAREDLVAVVSRLVDRPDRVRVHESERDGVVELVIDTAPEDRGKVIGRQGRTINALRSLLAVRDARLGERHVLDTGDD
ncbi:MAG: KH domain-containing protein [Holophagales bacterium]|nr:MAG: KH domain-containing protein [Holophagales bacterium]